MPLLHRLVRKESPAISFLIDGEPCEGRAGDTVLTAVLCQVERLRDSEFSGAPRAGFCQMGACQDCWVQLAGGDRLRACTTPLVEGMHIITRPGRGHG
ncbi:oxydoreductase, 2Fe-2S ferredoxin like subunit [Bradyrhizobium oligotrophicum S58]|uniref:Oxydoreductase, 2Fe-2S ferredoxin like subunit n=1 Tax=Bradyrhizobium oligotrophicum S58 TaxID=1245469 RepID=M4ZNI5_9BRAD|nr:(2Fe-2S)-binding protein [Bradyrhizobium oligotrophicum]BAM87785.1 oxydoreductase, 2Fe-2S ferredoxin like subunit [Bradyrhizobium oligotrophicum S58]